MCLKSNCERDTCCIPLTDKNDRSNLLCAFPESKLSSAPKPKNRPLYTSGSGPNRKKSMNLQSQWVLDVSFPPEYCHLVLGFQAESGKSERERERERQAGAGASF